MRSLSTSSNALSLVGEAEEVVGETRRSGADKKEEEVLHDDSHSPPAPMEQEDSLDTPPILQPAHSELRVTHRAADTKESDRGLNESEQRVFQMTWRLKVQDDNWKAKSWLETIYVPLIKQQEEIRALRTLSSDDLKSLRDLAKRCRASRTRKQFIRYKNQYITANPDTDTRSATARKQAKKQGEKRKKHRESDLEEDDSEQESRKKSKHADKKI